MKALSTAGVIALVLGLFAAGEVAPSTRDELAGFIKAEIAKWTKVAQSAGISLD